MRDKLIKEINEVLAEAGLEVVAIMPTDIKFPELPVENYPQDLYNQKLELMREGTEEKRIKEIFPEEATESISDLLNKEKATLDNLSRWLKGRIDGK